MPPNPTRRCHSMELNLRPAFLRLEISRKYKLDNEDWTIVGDLVSVLEVSHKPCNLHLLTLLILYQQYKRATVFFSHDSASIAAVIPAMDKLTSNLSPSSKVLYHRSILAAMKLARRKLNRYYSLTDLSSPYCITMGKSVSAHHCNHYWQDQHIIVLHPGLKLEYFWQQKWEPDWIETAENMTREEYIVTYEGRVKMSAVSSAKDEVEVSNISLTRPLI